MTWESLDSLRIKKIIVLVELVKPFKEINNFYSFKLGWHIWVSP
ncbi:hypothetical protein VTL71DRAFT_5852 [Oculimacula yallundae]|uniref:Uncharacterized protein n=1 Tax=Oculimacula yallundae TaxID=86028 RepID=A0ABR4BYT3_9HELO